MRLRARAQSAPADMVGDLLIICALSLASAQGLPRQTLEITAPFPDPNEEFGTAVDLDGRALVVGDPKHGYIDSGAVYVYERNGEEWQLVQEILPPNPMSSQLFGWSVALDGDLLAIGSFGIGVVHVYERDTAGPGLFGLIARLSSYGFSGYGYSLALQGETLIAGEPGVGDAANLGCPGSRLSIHERHAGGLDAWGRVFTLAGPFCGGLGYQVAVDGKRAAVTSPGELAPDSCRSCWFAPSPRIIVLERGERGWEVEAEIELTDPEVYLWAQSDLALSGDTLAFATFRFDVFSSSVSVFREEGGTWSERATIASPVAKHSTYGFALALRQDTLLIGNAQYGFNLALGAGEVWIHRRDLGGPDAWGAFGRIVQHGGVLGDGFGSALDFEPPYIAVGAPFEEVPSGDETGALILFDQRARKLGQAPSPSSASQD